MNHLTTMKVSQCFEILNATPGMAWDDVKKSYYHLAKRYHPDYNPHDHISESKFKELSGAFKMLETHYKGSNRNRRASVFSIFKKRPQPSPMNVKDSFHSAEVIEGPQSNPSEPPEENNVSKGGWSRWLQNLQIRFNNLERKIFLLDTRKNVRIAPHTAAQGGLIRLQNRKETFQVKIPPGDWSRMSLRVSEKGETSFFGKKRGDLVLNIQVIRPEQVDTGKSKFFYELQIAQGKIMSSRVQTLDSVEGPIKFVLPKGIKDGQTFTLKYRAKAESPDHVVKVHLV